MKSSLKKLRGLATLHHKHDSKEKRRHHPYAQRDELAQATQDMQDMKNCYDSLLNAAAATANSAYEFSEALRELGTCLLEKTALNDDEESGRVLLMIGKAQFELQKLVDSYRSHIFQTITTPSESLLNELRTLEEMKRQCEEKRETLDYMVSSQKEKGRSRTARVESFSSQQLLDAEQAYDEEATLFVFRLKSLKQGQSRSLLTQASRHHAAQLTFFRKGHTSLEAVEPHVKNIAEQQRIDYQFSGLEDDGSEDDDDYSYEANDDSELSFDYGHKEQDQEVVSTSRNSMELDQTDGTSAPVLTPEPMKENVDKKLPTLLSFNRGPRPGSQSAPIFPDKKFDPSEKVKEMRPSKKFHTYVLPTPADSKTSNLAPTDSISVSRQTSLGGRPTHLWHSSPLGLDNKDVKDIGESQFSVTALSSKPKSVLKESNINSKPIRMPPPLSDGLSFPHFNMDTTSNTKKIKRQAFSGPLTSSAWSRKPLSSPSTEYPPRDSAIPMHGTRHQPSSSPKRSPTASPPFMSPPKISELHELPRPPISSAKPTRPSSLIGYSAPLVSKGPEISATKRMPSVSSNMSSPLPTPPGAITRSFSIPSSSQRTAPSTVSRLSEVRRSDITDDVASPPLSPISLMNVRPVSETELDAAAKSKSEL